MSEQDNISLVKNAYDCFKQGKINDLLALLKEDIEWITPGPPDVMPTAGTRHGREAVAEFFSALSTQEDVELFDTQEYIAQGDKVVTITNYRGRIKATGKTAETVLVHLFQIKDGKVASFREFFDTAAIMPAFVTSQAAASN